MTETKRQEASRPECLTCTYNPRKATISQVVTLAGTLLTIMVMGGGVILATGRLSERIDNNCRTLVSTQRDVETAQSKADGKMDIELYKMLQMELTKRLDRLEGKVDQLLADNQLGVRGS